MKTMISVDWMQLYGECLKPFDSEDIGVQKRDYGTEQFAEAYDLYDNLDNRKIGVLLRCPRMSALPRNAGMLKFDNELLYSIKDFSDLMYYADILGFKAKRISRLDICADFQMTLDGMTAQEFANSLCNFSLIRKGRGKVASITRPKAVYTGVGETYDWVNNCEYLRWGNRRSDCSVYLYDKTLELKEKKSKPWIVQKWKEFGFDMSKPVFRLEFSLHQKQLKTLNKITGEKFRLDLEHINNMEQIKRLEQACVNKWFDIRIYKNVSKVERMPKKKIFDEIETHYDFTMKEDKAPSNRTDKQVIKKLWQTESNIRVQNDAERNLFEEAAILYAKRKGLEDWFYSCVKGWKKRYKQ